MIFSQLKNAFIYNVNLFFRYIVSSQVTDHKQKWIHWHKVACDMISTMFSLRFSDSKLDVVLMALVAKENTCLAFTKDLIQTMRFFGLKKHLHVEVTLSIFYLYIWADIFQRKQTLRSKEIYKKRLILITWGCWCCFKIFFKLSYSNKVFYLYTLILLRLC